MAGGNAHRARARRFACASTCVQCAMRPSYARGIGLKWKNKNGHRHNPTSGKKQKRSHR